MSVVIYLIGPSGVGKSACAAFASVALGIRHVSVDDLCKGNEFDWLRCNQTMLQIEALACETGENVIVDIGAGTQCSPELREFLSSRQDNLVLLYAPPLEVLPRNPAGGAARSLDEFTQTEYVSRRDLYSLAGHRVDLTGKSLDDAKKLFIEKMGEILKLQYPGMKGRGCKGGDPASAVRIDPI